MIKVSNRLTWSILGFIVLVFGGSLLHFTYTWSGDNAIVGVFSAVNESVWEHLKLGFWSLAAISLLDYWYLRPRRNYWFAKAIGITVMQLFILGFFYTYSSIVGTEILWVDIVSYVIGCALCQWIAYTLLGKPERPAVYCGLGIGLIILQFVLLTTFTFYPPHLPLFQDKHSLVYGMGQQ